MYHPCRMGWMSWNPEVSLHRDLISPDLTNLKGHPTTHNHPKFLTPFFLTGHIGLDFQFRTKLLYTKVLFGPLAKWRGKIMSSSGGNGLNCFDSFDSRGFSVKNTKSQFDGNLPIRINYLRPMVGCFAMILSWSHDRDPQIPIPGFWRLNFLGFTSITFLRRRGAGAGLQRSHALWCETGRVALGSYKSNPYKSWMFGVEVDLNPAKIKHRKGAPVVLHHPEAEE